MNNKLTKGQIINRLMENLPVVNPFEMDKHLLDIIEGMEDIAYNSDVKLPTLDYDDVYCV